MFVAKDIKKDLRVREKSPLSAVFLFQLEKPDCTDLRPPTDAGGGQRTTLSPGFQQTPLISYFSNSRALIDKNIKCLGTTIPIG